MSMTDESINEIEWTLQAITTEISNLIKLTHRLQDTDKQVLRECSIKLNQLLLTKLAA